MGRSFTDERNMPEIARLLEERGVAARLLRLGDDLIDLKRVRLDDDLYVLRNRTDLAMSVAADLHGAGAALLNPYPVSALLRDRIVTLRILGAAGIPVPETFVGSDVSQLLPALDRGPLILKTSRRPRALANHVVTNAAELAALGPMEEPLFAQRYLPPDRPADQKVYSIGGDLFGVLRVRPARTRAEKEGCPFPLSPALESLARRCGAAFGIDLFSVSIVESRGQAYVVDMSSFPGFKGVPDACARLTTYIYTAAERAARGEPIVPADSLATRAVAGQHAFRGSTLDLVLHALSTTPATSRELDRIQQLVDDIRLRAQGRRSNPKLRPPRERRRPRPSREASSPRVAMYSQGMVGFGHIRLRAQGRRSNPKLRPPRERRRPRPSREASSPRVAMYSQGMVGFGHIRRNASIAQALRASALQPAIVMMAEAWQAGALPMPPGVDFVTLPALRREPDGSYNPRFLLDVSDRDLIAMRARVLGSAMEVFEPDVLIVDHLPLGVANELTGTLQRLRQRGRTRCVLGVREVLYDPETVRRTWSDEKNMNAIREYYDAVWIYGDPAVYDPVREYELPEHVVERARYTGYLDQRPRLGLATRSEERRVGKECR